MKQRKGLIFLVALIFGGLFIAFTNTTPTDTASEQQRKLLTSIGDALENQHYSPKKIDDVFSEQIFKKYLEVLDGDKSLFLQSDIVELNKYKNTIDDEIHGASIEFVPSANKIFLKRVAECMTIYREILSKPFDFSVNESIASADKLNYANTEAERTERIRKSMKLYTLDRVIELQELRAKSIIDSVKNQSDELLQNEARQRVLKIMDKIYNKKLNIQKIEDRFNDFLNVIANYSDPHTDYFPPVEKRAFDEQMSNSFFGIGAQLREQDEYVKIVSLMNGYPAARSGEIAPNDIILKVAQGRGTPVDITGYGVNDAVKLIRGERNTEVTLTIKKEDGTIKIVTLKREEIVQDEGFARSAIINQNNKKIGYIYLPDFYANFDDPRGNRCSDDVAKEIIHLQAENVEGIVIDLRNNGGGSLYEVVKMVGLFIKQGPIVQVRDRDGKSSLLSDNNSDVLYDGPLAVMVNELSASASEIFAAAIQDYKRGIILGSTSTYGKGTVQRYVSFGNRVSNTRTDLGAMKLTFQKFYRINGGSTQLKGVEPDVVLPDSYEYLKIREKDNPIALGWDEINKANYDLAQDKFDYANTIKIANAKVSTNTSLSLIKENGKWLALNTEKPLSLNIEKNKADQKLVNSTVTQNNNLSRLKEEMNITVTKPDYPKYYENPDKQKGERYQLWLKNLKTDIYISTSADIVGIMINNQNVALKH